MEACPYELAIRLASESQVIVADYFQLMSPMIRDIFLKKISKGPENSIIVVDEAHNLVGRARGTCPPQ